MSHRQGRTITWKPVSEAKTVFYFAFVVDIKFQFCFSFSCLWTSTGNEARWWGYQRFQGFLLVCKLMDTNYKCFQMSLRTTNKQLINNVCIYDRIFPYGSLLLISNIGGCNMILVNNKFLCLSMCLCVHLSILWNTKNHLKLKDQLKKKIPEFRKFVLL